MADQELPDWFCLLTYKKLPMKAMKGNKGIEDIDVFLHLPYLPNNLIDRLWDTLLICYCTVMQCMSWSAELAEGGGCGGGGLLCVAKYNLRTQWKLLGKFQQNIYKHTPTSSQKLN